MIRDIIIESSQLIIDSFSAKSSNMGKLYVNGKIKLIN
jgi:hypothetical protein